MINHFFNVQLYFSQTNKLIINDCTPFKFDKVVEYKNIYIYIQFIETIIIQLYLFVNCNLIVKKHCVKQS